MANERLQRELDRAIQRLSVRLSALFEQALRAQFPTLRRGRKRTSSRSPLPIRAVGAQPWPANTNGTALLDELGRYAEEDTFGWLGAPLVATLLTASVVMTRPPPRGAPALSRTTRRRSCRECDPSRTRSAGHPSASE